MEVQTVTNLSLIPDGTNNHRTALPLSLPLFADLPTSDLVCSTDAIAPQITPPEHPELQPDECVVTNQKGVKGGMYL